MSDIIKCPKCDRKHLPNATHEYGEWECDNCSFKFIVETDEHSKYYSYCQQHEFSEHETIKGDKLKTCIHCFTREQT